MITEIRDGRPVDRIGHELTDVEAYQVRGRLAAEGIRVVLGKDVDRVVHIYALEPTTTAQEVRAIGAFREITDCRLAWHGAVTS